jgi:uncharacterized protein YciI
MSNPEEQPVPIFALLVEFQGDPPSDELLEAHRNWLFPKFEEGSFIVSGALDAIPGRAPSALGLIHADTLAAAEAVVADDPFVLAGACAHQVVPFTARVRATDIDTFFNSDTKAIQRTS